MIKRIEWFGSEFNIDDSNQGIYGIEFWKNSHEPIESDFFSRCIKTFPTFTFIDCGAAIGAYTLPALAKGAKVLAFEPEKKVFNILKKNIEVNNFAFENIINSALVSSKENKRKFGGDALMKTEHDFTESETEFSKVLENNSSAIVKMDIEGAEWPLLQDSEIFKQLLQNKVILILAPHIGFHSHNRDNNFLSLLQFRFGVMREIITIVKIQLNFGLVYELGEGKLTFIKILRRNLFSAKGWKNALVVINDLQLINTLSSKKILDF